MSGPPLVPFGALLGEGDSRNIGREGSVFCNGRPVCLIFRRLAIDRVQIDVTSRADSPWDDVELLAVDQFIDDSVDRSAGHPFIMRDDSDGFPSQDRRLDLLITLAQRAQDHAIPPWNSLMKKRTPAQRPKSVSKQGCLSFVGREKRTPKSVTFSVKKCDTSEGSVFVVFPLTILAIFAPKNRHDRIAELSSKTMSNDRPTPFCETGSCGDPAPKGR